MIEFPLQTNMNLNNKEKDNNIFRSINRKRESIHNTPFIKKSKEIWQAPKQLQNNKELLQNNQNETKTQWLRGGRVWRSDLRTKIDLKRYGNVIRNGKEELIGGGLKFPTTTKSFNWLVKHPKIKKNELQTEIMLGLEGAWLSHVA